MPCAVSGRRKISLAPSAVEPICVENIRLNWRTSVQFLEPDMGQTIPTSSIRVLTIYDTETEL